MGGSSLEKILRAYLEDILWHTEAVANTTGSYQSTTELVNQYYKSNEKHKTKNVHFRTLYESILANIDLTRTFKDQIEKSKRRCDDLEKALKICQESKDYYKTKCKVKLSDKYHLDDDSVLKGQNREIEKLSQACQNISEDVSGLRAKSEAIQEEQACIERKYEGLVQKRTRLKRYSNTLALNSNVDDVTQREHTFLEDNGQNLRNVDANDDKLEDQIKALNDRLRNEERERRNLQVEIEECEEELILWEKRCKDLQRTHAVQLEEESSNCLEENSGLTEAYHSLRNANEKLVAKNEQLEEQISALNNRLQNEEQERKRLQVEIEECEEELLLWEKRCKDLQSLQLTKTHEAAEEIEEALSAHDEKSAPTEAYQSVPKASVVQNEQLEQEISALNDRLQKEERERKSLQLKIEDFEEEALVWERRYKDLSLQLSKTHDEEVKNQEEKLELIKTHEETELQEETLIRGDGRKEDGPNGETPVVITEALSLYSSFKAAEDLIRNGKCGSSLKKEMIRLHGKNLQGLVVTNKKLSKTQRDDDEGKHEFRKKLNDVKEDIKHLEEDRSVERFHEVKTKFEEEMRKILRETRDELQNILSASELNEKYEELISVLNEENHRLKALAIKEDLSNVGQSLERLDVDSNHVTNKAVGVGEDENEVSSDR